MPAKKSTSKKRNNSVSVRSFRELVVDAENFLARITHERISYSLSTKARKAIVQYGPWLSLVYLFVVVPATIGLAETNAFQSATAIWDVIFNRNVQFLSALLIGYLALFAIDGFPGLFKLRSKSWRYLEVLALFSAGNAIWNFFERLNEPAAPLLAFLLSWAALFILLDVRSYYKK